MKITDRYEIVDKIESGAYKHNAPRPSLTEIEKTITEEVESTFVGTLAEIKAELERRLKGAKAKYKRECSQWQASKDVLFAQYQNDIFELFDMEDHPMRFKCFEKAWNLSNGYIDTIDMFESFLELVRPEDS
jgi:hypothetical protein